jgi:hypothetical protein
LATAWPQSCWSLPPPNTPDWVHSSASSTNTRCRPTSAPIGRRGMLVLEEPRWRAARAAARPAAGDRAVPAHRGSARGCDRARGLAAVFGMQSQAAASVAWRVGRAVTNDRQGRLSDDDLERQPFIQITAARRGPNPSQTLPVTSRKRPALARDMPQRPLQGCRTGFNT